MSKVKSKSRQKNSNTRSITAEINNINEDDRSIELSFSSEKPVTRWFGSEILSHDTTAVDLVRLNEIGVLLFNHNRNEVIGKVEKAWIDEAERKGRAIVRFDEDTESEKIFQKVKNETLRGVSVGYTVDAWEEVKNGKVSSNGRFIGPCDVATRWVPNEISIVSVPADENVGVGRELNDNSDDETSKTEDDENNSENGENDDTNLDDNSQEEDKTEGEGEREMDKNANKNSSNERPILELERQRVSEINSLCREFNVDVQQFIEDGSTVDSVRSYILEQLRSKKAPLPGSVQVISDERDKFRDAVSDSILMRAGMKVEKAAPGATDLRGLRLRDIAVECLRAQGISDASRYDNEKLFREALTPGSNFSAILDNTVNKSMKTAYNAQTSTYKEWVSKGSNPDFKATTKYQISEAGDLKLITENGEFEHDEMKDEGVKTSLLTYGKSFSISRQALINDDISIITKLPQAYVRAADRGINKLVYKMLGGNPKIYDNVELFHSKHANLAKTVGGITVETIGEARRAMRTQKNLRGNETLNIAPQFLIVPAALETQAAQFLSSISDPAFNNSNIVNPFNNKLKLIVDPELDLYSEDAWYLASSPFDCDTIEVTYLNGSDMPTLESMIPFDNLGMKWRIFMDYGVTAIDYRGLYKNAGK